MKQAFVPEALVISYRDVPMPEAGPGDLILKVARIGICGSDLHVFKGKHPLVSFPLVQGHEFSGYVHAMGRGVKGFRVGDLVAVQPAVGCGKCRGCAVKAVNQCRNLSFIGGNLTGGGSEYFRVPQTQVIRIPAGVDVDEAAMTEPLAVAVHAVRKIPYIRGKTIVVAGSGTIGNLVAQTARYYGAGGVLVVERNPFRRETAARLGFQTIDPDDGPPEETIAALTADTEVQAAFECVGHGDPLNLCIRVVERGGHVIVLGVYSNAVQTEMILVQDKETRVLGSLMYVWNDYREAVRLMRLSKIDLKILQTHHFPLDRWEEGYKILMERPDESIKVLIDV